jgi:hypothetical protein
MSEEKNAIVYVRKNVQAVSKKMELYKKLEAIAEDIIDSIYTPGLTIISTELDGNIFRVYGDGFLQFKFKIINETTFIVEYNDFVEQNQVKYTNVIDFYLFLLKEKKLIRTPKQLRIFYTRFLDLKAYYDLELLMNVGDFKVGELVRGKCITKNNFGKFKRWFLETYSDCNNLCIAEQTNQVRRLFRETFKLVETFE